jgi:chromosome segregation ATPase
VITITEKRMQELESRIPILHAHIESQQEKMAKIDAFAHVIEQIQIDLHKLHDKMHQFLVQNKESNLSFSLTIQQFNKNLNEDHESILEIKKSIVNISNLATQNSTIQSNHKLLMNELNDNQNKEKSRVSDMEKVLMTRVSSLEDKMIAAQNAVQQAANSVEKQSAAWKEQVKLHDDLMKSVEKELKEHKQVSMDKLAQLSLDMNNQLKAAFEGVSKASEKSIDYSDQIADIKKDLASVLSVVHVTATQSPDQEKANAKIKAMENNIAHVYELLKKCENR